MFLFFEKFEPQRSYKHGSYKKKACTRRLFSPQVCLAQGLSPRPLEEKTDSVRKYRGTPVSFSKKGSLEPRVHHYLLLFLVSLLYLAIAFCIVLHGDMHLLSTLFVEWGDFPSVRPYVCLSVRSPPLGHPARPEAQPASLEA